MRKIIIIIVAMTSLGCMDFNKRQVNLQKMYPENVITPATGMISGQGYEFLMEDTINNQIYAVSFGVFSYTRISKIRNIK